MARVSEATVVPGTVVPGRAVPSKAATAAGLRWRASRARWVVRPSIAGGRATHYLHDTVRNRVVMLGSERACKAYAAHLASVVELVGPDAV